MTRRPLVNGHGAGFTLIETVLATSIFLALTLALVTVVDTARGSHVAVSQGVAQNEGLRETITLLSDELRATSDSLIAVTQLADGNSEVTFMMPIEVGGNLDWGVEERELDPDPALQVRPDWSVRYTIEDVPDGTGYVNKRLLRQILDDTGALQLERVVAEGLNDGGNDPPGFTVQQVGEMWEVNFSTDGHATNTSGRKAVFHVSTRN